MRPGATTTAAVFAAIAAAAFVAAGCVWQLSTVTTEGIAALETCLKTQGIISETSTPSLPVTSGVIKGLLALAGLFTIMAGVFTTVAGIPERTSAGTAAASSGAPDGAKASPK
jgi:hypothetical protein